jgi:hypothetical protein
MIETDAAGGQDPTAAGRIILMIASPLAALLVILGIVYGAGASGRHQAALAAAGCEPSLFISGLPCTTRQMLISQYEAIVTPASRQLNADMAAYHASEGRNLATAEAALTAEVATEQALGKSLAAATFTPQNRATADALITNAASNGTNVPLAAVTFTPQISVMVDALIQANQARATLTAEQARSSSLAELRSFNHRVQVAGASVQTEMNLIVEALQSRPPAG